MMFFPFLLCHSQELRDSLNAAIKIDSRRVMRGPGNLQTGLEGMRSIITPLGEGDPIHWAQAMPGVTTGADGSSAFYVRGGNLGNNLFSLDCAVQHVGSPMQVLTRPNPAWFLRSDEIGHVQDGMAIDKGVGS